MGYRISYLGLRCSIQEAAELLELELRGDVCEAAPTAGSWMGQRSGENWTIVWLEDANFVQRNGTLIASASDRTDVIACEVNETTMWSSAQYWSKGHLKWRVSHDGSLEDTFNLTEVGGLPREYGSIREEHVNNQRAEGAADEEIACDHVFEVPLDLAALTLRFRHDSVPDLQNYVSVLLPRKPGVFARLLSLFSRD